MKRYLFLLIFIILTTSSSIYSQISHTIEFNTQGVTIGTKVGGDSTLYADVIMDNSLPGVEVGNPGLPVYYVNYILPPEVKVIGFTITASTSSTYNLNYPIFPNQYSPSCGIDCDQPPFVSPNTLIYSSLQAYPTEMLTVAHQGYFDGAQTLYR